MSGPGTYQKQSELMTMSMDGLPKQFVSSLRILFDILDENRTGYVHLKDIESRWSDDGIRGLPAGVVDGLRRVTPHNGLLSFDRFVAGLKLVLSLRQGNESRRPFTPKENKAPYQDFKISQSDAPPFPERDSHSGYNVPRRAKNFYNTSIEPNSNLSQGKTDEHQNKDNQIFAGRINENNRNASGQTTYRPQREESPVHRETAFAYAIKADVRNYPTTMGSHQSPSRQPVSNVYSGPRGFPRNPRHHSESPPAVPPRTITNHVGANGHNTKVLNHMRKSQSGPELHHAQSPPVIPPRVHQPNSHVLVDLKNWQREWTANQQSSAGNLEHWHQGQRNVQTGRHDNAIYANIEQFQRKAEDPSKQQVPLRATVRRHGSGRRHTLSSGIDHNMLKRMKQLEEEKVILQSGLEMVDTARDWYLKQLSMISDKQALLGKVSYNDNSLEAHQERMSFQRARIAEVNQQLGTLVESSEKGFPLHMNLAMTSQMTAGSKEKFMLNTHRKLMEDVNHKTNQISQLEKEKATLIRDLFEARSKIKPRHDDTTFM